MKTCTPRGVIGSPQTAAMRFHDGAADTKSHTGTMNFGGEEGIKDLVCLRRQTHAGIADRYEELLIFSQPRLDGELPDNVHILHCIDAVCDEVHHDLLQLQAISHDL